MQPLAKQQIFPPSWPVLTFGQRDSEENRCLKPCTLITYLVTAPISLLGQLNELPVKRRTSAFICTLPSVYFGIKPRFFNITWHELQLGRKWSRLKTWNFPSATTLMGVALSTILLISSGETSSNRDIFFTDDAAKNFFPTSKISAQEIRHQFFLIWSNLTIMAHIMGLGNQSESWKIIILS